ncbi:MAG: polysaccharide biosynthesis C-terminal domain-containing protein [Brumimicrobium sp.]|nr:polysaccharide biosynthesis C-terminal domain-containing protein [Brumimicrobium sp.]MCO5268386.1 polysaccharide biosynthesis C-terminal domain-containing protein [Brumimicrobium sp.]
MGIVQRQSIKNSIVNYVGILLGGLSTLFIYPLDWELYGSIQFSLSTALLLNALFSLGSFSLVNKYFPYFKKRSIKGFLSLVFTYSIINIFAVAIILYIFKTPFEWLLIKGGFDIKEIYRNLFIILPIALMYVFINILRSQSFNFGRIVYPDLISNFSLKLIVPLIILLSYFLSIDYIISGWILILYHLIIILLLAWYIHTLGGIDFSMSIFSKISRKKHLEMTQYMLYNALNHVGNILVYKIDLVMIGLLLSTTKVGYYSIFLFLSVVIEIPTKAVFQITAPMVSQALEHKEYSKIEKMYKDASANLYIIGVFLFFIIWFNMDIIFQIMTKGEDLVMFKVVFLMLGLTKIIDMATSINFHIISYSKYYKVNTLFIFILAISNIILNYILIGKFDINGAAISTFISMLAFNFLKTIFVYLKFNMQPFGGKLLLITVILLLSIALPYIAPTIFQSYYGSILFTLFFTILFISIVYKLKITAEINAILDKYLVHYFK